VVWISEPALRQARERLASGKLVGRERGITVSSLDEFLEHARTENTTGFVDHVALPELSRLDPGALPENIVAVCAGTLTNAVGWLQPHPWLSHVVSTTMLDHPIAPQHFHNLGAAFNTREPKLLDWIGPEVEGRRVRLTQANKRAERLEKMTEYLDGKGASARTCEHLRDAAEELLTNAFYDAPVTAGAMTPISRTQDVQLPDKNACDLAYGCSEDLAIVRVRDPFGSLSRRRLVEVLSRCARSEMSVQVDESMGGAGLGMWRIFSTASYVAISVVKQRYTDILVGIAKRAPGQRPFAFHLFFSEGGKRRFWQLLRDETQPGVNKSVLLELKSK
jgi:hypothetical protein